LGFASLIEATLKPCFMTAYFQLGTKKNHLPNLSNATKMKFCYF